MDETKESVGCGNHGCYIEKPKGQATNGGCSCLKPLGTARAIEIKKKLRSLDFYKRRVEELSKNKHLFPEPYLTMICNVIANGKISPHGG